MYWLDLAFHSDLENKKEKILYKIFEILPAFLSFSTLFLAIFLSWYWPIGVVVFIIAFDVYWLAKVFYLSGHQIASFIEMRKHLKKDWLSELKKISSWDEIYHLILLPMYKEGIKVVRDTFDALLKSEYPKEKMIVVLAVEERGGEKAKNLAKEIENNCL